MPRGRKEWEYKTVRFYGEGTGKLFATHADGARVGGLTATGVVAQPELHTFLSQLGLDGWEVVSMAGASTEGLIILQREVLYG